MEDLKSLEALVVLTLPLELLQCVLTGPLVDREWGFITIISYVLLNI